jgi:alpha-beta hydrolase superfamily lysophospholipase
VVWHMADAPRSEQAMAAALPLHGLPAWRVYLGLPMCGTRLPGGELEAFFQLGYEDAVLNLFDPMTAQAVEEFPAALAGLRSRFPIGDGPVALVGASAGALVALSVLAGSRPDSGSGSGSGSELSVRAAALISPAVQLAAVVELNERRFGITYPWSDASRRAADRLDFLARSDEIAGSGADVLLVAGQLDDEPGIRQPAAQLWQALSTPQPGRATMVDIPDMAHALAEEPGLAPAPQTPHAARVDDVVTDWLGSRL